MPTRFVPEVNQRRRSAGAETDWQLTADR